MEGRINDFGYVNSVTFLVQLDLINSQVYQLPSQKMHGVHQLHGAKKEARL